jgi:alpha-tubulin suppressor-like RCC1 family protein
MEWVKKLKNFLNLTIKNLISHGQIGDGTSGINRILPVAVDTTGALSGKGIIKITTGGSHTCVIASDDNSYCWGYN